ncbi:MAG: dienelactone hydrolase family protein [Mycobacteriales bacterium]
MPERKHLHRRARLHFDGRLPRPPRRHPRARTAHGYAAIAPDFYHRTCPGIELAADAHGRERGFELLQQLTRTQALDDLAATIEWVAVNRAPLAGVVGLSLGGHLAYLAATQFELPAVAIFYGGWIPTTDITISQPEPTIAATAQIGGRVQMFVGCNDPIVPAEHRRQITDALTDAGTDHQLIEYPGVGHGFLCDRRASFHPEAANDAWNRLLRFLEQS